MYDAKLSTDKWFPVIMIDAAEAAVTGITPASVGFAVKYHYEGASSQSVYAATGHWVEAGSGEYWLEIGAGEFAATGKYQVTVECTGCKPCRIYVDAKTYTEEEKGLLVNYIYGRVGSPSDLGEGSDVSSMLFAMANKANGVNNFNQATDSLEALSDAVVLASGDIIDTNAKVNLLYGRIGTPANLGSGSTIAINLSDINADVGTVDTKANAIIADVGTVDGKVTTAIIDVGSLDAKVGVPIDLGDGTTLSDNMTSIAGKTAGAASFNRFYDSMEALSDAESDNLSVDTLKDYLFNRTVGTRHGNGKPQQIFAGTGLNQIEVRTTLDTDPGEEDFIQTEVII